MSQRYEIRRKEGVAILESTCIVFLLVSGYKNMPDSIFRKLKSHNTTHLKPVFRKVTKTNESYQIHNAAVAS